MKQAFVVLLLGCCITASASGILMAPHAAADSILPLRISLHDLVGDGPVTNNLTAIENRYALTGDHRRAFTGLLGLARVKTAIWSRKLRLRFYSDLAGISASLKLYPLAMSSYYNTIHVDGENRPDSAWPASALIAADSLGTADVKAANTASQPVKIADILSAFRDGKETAAYAILAEVKQPIPGKRKSFTHLNNVGHMFITLIKYNKDNTVVCRSFGFYPRKSTLISATPLSPNSPSTVKNDTAHEWDEAAGKFISARRFARIVDILATYDHVPYNLNHNNCTDFGLSLARTGGIDIRDASGHWPLGKGNNPGSAGQSILEGKVYNIDQENQQPLFVSANLPTKQR
jgi:hypothetical protein